MYLYGIKGLSGVERLVFFFFVLSNFLFVCEINSFVSLVGAVYHGFGG